MKKWLGFLIAFVILSGSLFFFLKSQEKVLEQVQNTDDYQKEILNYDFANSQIDDQFLNWFLANYKEEAEKLAAAITNNSYQESFWYELTGQSLKVLEDMARGLTSRPNVKIIESDDITISFVGDVSLADNYLVMPEYDKRGQGILGLLDNNVIKSLKESTIAVANNEFTVSTRGEALKNKMFTFRAHPDRLKIYQEMGIDLVTLANNHVFDFGEDAFLDMLAELDKINMPHIGAGKNLEAASQPFYFIVNGKKIAFVNANRSEKNILTPGATKESPGVLRCYDPTYFQEVIKKAKAESDYVFALVHWGKESYHTLEDVQKETARLYLESGADAIIGTHAHVLQGMEFYQNKLIAYNLGNFIFNDKTIDTGILKIKIKQDGSLQYFFEGCLQSNTYTKMLEGEAKEALLKKMEDWSINAQFLATGEIIKKD